MLEGFNGLGAGLGIIVAFTLVVLSLVHDRLDGVYLLVPLLGSLIAFLWFNKYPAEVFPGDTMMLFMGAALAASGILSSLHVQTFFIFLPMIAEFFLKFRGHFKAENYSTDAVDGHLIYNGRIESLTHVFMKHSKCSERGLVYRIWLIEVVFCLIVVIVDSTL
jgi:UDP-N-acetylglucosamine--dolichyl-phosphate N-acetylglucosaminephosphotransferase